MMIRNRSRAVGSKQGLMADSTTSPVQSPTGAHLRPSFFLSPRPLGAVAANGCKDGGEVAALSPTSILDVKQLGSSLVNAIFSDKRAKTPPFDHPPSAGAGGVGHQPVGLGLIDAIRVDESEPKQCSKLERRMSLFGSKLKVHIPFAEACAVAAAEELPEAPIEFGVKNRDAQLALLSPAGRFVPSLGCCLSSDDVSSPLAARVLSGDVPLSEMEASEDYTRVIAHGPNPKTTHIFDDCVIESSVDGFSVVSGATARSRDLLSFCHTCRKDLRHGGSDIFIFRGEKAFCSSQCRSEAIGFHQTSNGSHR